MRRNTLALALVWVFISSPSKGQVTYTLTDNGPFTGFAAATYLPTAGYPLGGHDPRGLLPLAEYSNLPPAAIVGGSFGGHAHDQATSTIFSCNGFYVQAEGHPLYDAPGIAASAGLGVYFPMNRITGMTVDHSQGQLYCTDGRYLRSFDVSGSPPIYTPLQGALAPIHLSWLNSNVQLSGLGFESQTSRIWAVADNGTVYRFATDGTPIGPQPVALVVSQSPLSGCAVNTSNGPGAFAMPFCSFQTSGYHILASDDSHVYDALNPLAAPLPIAGTTGAARGLAFSCDGQLIPASSTCPMNGGAVGNPNIWTGSFSGIRSSKPTVFGNVNNLELIGGPANSNATLLFDYCPIQQGGVPLPTGDVLYIWPLSPFAVLQGHSTNAFGSAQFPLPTSTAPAGVQFSYQWYFNDVANPTIYGCFSDAMTIVCGLP